LSKLGFVICLVVILIVSGFIIYELCTGCIGKLGLCMLIFLSLAKLNICQSTKSVRSAHYNFNFSQYLRTPISNRTPHPEENINFKILKEEMSRFSPKIKILNISNLVQSELSDATKQTRGIIIFCTYKLGRLALDFGVFTLGNHFILIKLVQS
jgi:hypothetical protein